MIHDMKVELQILLGQKKGKYRRFNIEGLVDPDIYYVTAMGRPCNWAITFKCIQDPFHNIKLTEDRLAYFKDRPNLFRHGSMVCLLIDNDIVAFPKIHRNETLLSSIPPTIVLKFTDQKVIEKTLLRLHGANHIRLLSIATTVFAYEPILKALQEKEDLPFSWEFLFWSEGDPTLPLSTHVKLTEERRLYGLIRALMSEHSQDLKPYLSTSKSIRLDEAQAASFLRGLTQRVSLIQGPPGSCPSGSIG
jgi:hypothetical protein